MKKYLITGIGGFVGRYFWEYLLQHEQDFCVMGLDMMPDVPWEHSAFQYVQTNLMCLDAVQKIIATFQPDYIVHLAAISSVGQSWKEPSGCFSNNTAIFLNLAEAVRMKSPSTRLLSIGSSEEYGNYPTDAMPLREDYELKPCNPYAVARVAQEMLSRLYADSYGLNIVMTRSFNHIGPRQRDMFVVASFAKQLVQIKKKSSKGAICTGNIDIIRDFIDVRDAVDAYWHILVQGKPGEVYNVCSGKGIRLRDIIRRMAVNLGIEPTIEIDHSLVRPNDNPVIIGDNFKIKKFLNWVPRIPIEKTLDDIILYFRAIEA